MNVQHLSKIILLMVVVIINQICAQTEESCDSLIYCQGKLLDLVQMAAIFNDSKTFVDMSLRFDANQILQDFDELLNQTNNNPSPTELRGFVDQNFIESNEFTTWTPTDYKEDPEFLNHILDDNVREFATNIIKIWPTLARKIKDDVQVHPERHSIIPVPNGFIIPGGRFREFYYWDSYWIIKGLLLNEMTDTVKGMLENFLTLIDQYGYIPNGARVYYLNRSQPPLFTAMVYEYIKKTNDNKFLKDNIHLLDRELRYFLDNKFVEIEKNGVKYNLAHYISQSGTPRPESYREDVLNANYYPNPDDKRQLYADLKSGAESGWDFSSRWIIDNDGGNNANLSQIKTRRIIPVDLNAFLCQAFRILSIFHSQLGQFDSAVFWYERFVIMKKTIEEVLFDQQDGIWYDYDIELKQSRKFFYPSNLSPLWAQCFSRIKSKFYGAKAVQYLMKHGIFEYPGGVPTSLGNTGEQWDLPNAWPPLQSIVIYGLEQSGHVKAQDYAEELAKKWIRSNMLGFNNTNQMFEKYDAEHPGQYGGGGEYQVQNGFGWTNGLVLDLINYYYTDSSAIKRKR